MSDVYVRKNLQPAGGSWQTLYTVGACNRAIGVTVHVCSDQADTFGISLDATGGGYSAAGDLIPDNMPINGPNAMAATEGLTLLTGDVLRVRSGGGNVRFWIFADEIS